MGRLTERDEARQVCLEDSPEPCPGCKHTDTPGGCPYCERGTAWISDAGVGHFGTWQVDTYSECIECDGRGICVECMGEGVVL